MTLSAARASGGVCARELAAMWRDEWLEFGVAGLHSEEVVRSGDVDPGRFGAICVAAGLERCAMIRCGIDDIRKLWSPAYVVE